MHPGRPAGQPLRARLGGLPGRAVHPRRRDPADPSHISHSRALTVSPRSPQAERPLTSTESGRSAARYDTPDYLMEGLGIMRALAARSGCAAIHDSSHALSSGSAESGKAPAESTWTTNSATFALTSSSAIRFCPYSNSPTRSGVGGSWPDRASQPDRQISNESSVTLRIIVRLLIGGAPGP